MFDTWKWVFRRTDVSGNHDDSMRIKEVFEEIIVGLGNSQQIASEKWEVISSAYNSPNRFYHNLNHIESMFLLLEKQKDSINNWESIVFGLLYHDIVYDSTKSNNEELSAQLAKQELLTLNVSRSQIQKVEDLIISTKNHVGNSDNDTNIFLDADLSILGSDTKTYTTYSKNVRIEYVQYPSYVYNQGRIKILEYFLKLDSIYKTDYCKSKFEQSAQENLNHELNELKKINLDFNRTNTNEYVCYLEFDGDLSEFFYNSAKILDSISDVNKIIYYPGWFDSGYYRFLYKETKLHLEYDRMLGTLLRTECNPSDVDISNAKEIFQVLTEVRMTNENLERVWKFYKDKNTANTK